MTADKTKTPVFGRDVAMAMLGVNLMVLTATLDMSIVNISLPTLVTALDTDFPTVQWVVLSYVLAIACLLLLFSRLGDMKSKKAIFSSGLVIFALGSLFCGIAPGIHSLIAARGLQGVGGAMSQALGLAIITEIAPPGSRGRAIGIVGAAVSLGLCLGPPLGGMLIELAGWRFIFLVNLPICLVAYLTVRRHLPELPPKHAAQRFDIAGAVIAFLSLGCYALGMTMAENAGFEDPATLGLLAASAILMGAFIVTEMRAAEPMLDLTLFKNALFSLNLIMGVLVFLSLAGGFIIPFFLQSAQGRGLGEAGLLMMVIPLCMGAVAPKAGSLSDKYGSRLICLIGLLILAFGCFTTSLLTISSPWWVYLLCQAPIGFGAGIFQSPNNSAIMGAVPPHRLGVASGLINYSRIFGQTSGLPLIGVIFTAIVSHVTGHPMHADVMNAPAEALAKGVTGAYRIQAYMLLATCIPAAAALYLDRRQKRLQRTVSP